MSDKYTFRPLLPDPSADPDAAGENTSLRSASQLNRRWYRYLYITNTVISWTLVFLLSVIIIYERTTGPDRFRQHKLYPSQLTYSPAQDVIEYEVKVFHKGQEDMPSRFQGPPSPELDEAWESLYEGMPDHTASTAPSIRFNSSSGGISSISKDQARRLVNYTTEIPNHDGEYIVQLDVFHQLHCLVRTTTPRSH